MSEPGHKPRVFIIDDEREIDRAFARLFNNGWSVTWESDPLVARERLLSDETFDAVLLDIIMPNLNGFQLFEELKTKAPNRIRRIVFLTAAPSIPAVESFFVKNKAVWLEKPFRESQIEAIVAMLHQATFPRGP